MRFDEFVILHGFLASHHILFTKFVYLEEIENIPVSIEGNASVDFFLQSSPLSVDVHGFAR